ncbi:hypothetical protein D3C73_1108320 [compost metagenome]
MRQIADRLNHTFKNDILQFIQQKSQRNRCNKSQYQLKAAHHQRVSQHPVKCAVLKQNPKMLQARPFLLRKASGRFIILKSHGPTPNGKVFKHKSPNYEWKTHQSQRSLMNKTAEEQTGFVHSRPVHLRVRIYRIYGFLHLILLPSVPLLLQPQGRTAFRLTTPGI